MKLWGVNGNRVDADESGRLKTRSISSSISSDAAEQEKSYIVTSTYTTSGGDEEVIYIKNAHATENFEVHKIILGTAANAVFTLSTYTGTAAGTSITPVGSNVGQTKTASLTCFGNAAVTGLTPDDTLAIKRVLANTSGEIEVNGAIKLKPNTNLGISNSATGSFEVTLIGHFSELED